MTEPMDKLEIIEMLLSTYTENPSNRALEFDLIPRFRTYDRKCCPIGLVLNKVEQYTDLMGGVVRAISRYHELHPEIKSRSIIWLPKGMVSGIFDGHQIQFWQDLQKFHDTDEYYTASGLSPRGKLQLRTLKQKWELTKLPRIEVMYM